LKKIVFLILATLLLRVPLFSGEADIIDLANKHYSRGDYYSSKTETMRYQALYPKGKFFPNSMVLAGKSCLKGENFACAVHTLYSCYRKYPSVFPGEESLYLLGYLKLQQGSPYYALRRFQEYGYVYPGGFFKERVELNICYAIALTGDLENSINRIKKFNEKYPKSSLKKEAVTLEDGIIRELNRPRKSMLVSVLGSVVIPGFGHFYTGNYSTGFLSFFTNALLVYLIYNGCQSGNMFQTVFFSLAEFSFYQYSIYGAIRDVYDYNSRKNYYRRLKLGLSHQF